MHFTNSSSWDGANAVLIPAILQDKKPILCSSFNSLILEEVLKTGDFKAKEGELFFVYDPALSSKRILLLGLGKEEDLSVETIRKAFGASAKALKKKHQCEKIAILLPSFKEFTQEQVVNGIIDGLILGSYEFNALKNESLKEDDSSSLKEVALIGATDASMEICKKQEMILAGNTLAKDLVNGNADDVTPSRLCEEARSLHSSLKVSILGKKELEKEKLGLILAVNRGSHHEPALILIEYRGNPSSDTFSAIVGKGITYDTGGLNLKPTGSMETMKCDMAGSAAVLGTMKALASLKLPVNVIGVVATSENAVSSNSYKPGDVYTSYSGKTIEITNTDAEGRLVLADAISYVQKQYKLSRLIDLATLTGSVVVALGEEATGLYTNDESLAKSLAESGECTFERLWRMPIFKEYKEQLKSQIADMKNCGSRQAGSCVAAVFLKDFVQEGLPWAHLDIAGTAYRSDTKGYHTTPATGVGVRLLIDFFSKI